MRLNLLFLLTGGIIVLSCNNSNQAPGNHSGSDTSSKTDKNMITSKHGSFGYDKEFLQKKDSGLVLLQSGDGLSQVIVSAKYQGKVFTSTADGLEGKSYGWVNYKAFEGPEDPHMNAYGGEDRLWLGPEGGIFSLYFKPGAKMEFDNWKTPAAIDTEPWTLVNSSKSSVSMSKEMQLLNYAGTTLQIKLDRSVNLLEKENIQSELGVQVPSTVKSVAFQTVNSLTNTGGQAWNEKTGAPCMWNLDMLAPSDTCIIVIPYNENATGKVATTDYFGEIEKDRIKYSNGILYFKADGKSRGKLGLSPQRAKTMAGSYDAINQVLTIVKFDLHREGKYLNQEWRTDRAPFSGDAVNAYNDGPLADGNQMGPFYELESVSPAAFLKPGEAQVHHHSVFHFSGDKEALNEISQKLLGVSIKEIENKFN